jgi:hypothetical protein
VQPVHAYSAYGLRPIMDLLLSLIIWSKLFWAGDGYLKIVKISPAIRNDTAEKRSMILTEGGILFMSFFHCLICERGSGPPRLPFISLVSRQSLLNRLLLNDVRRHHRMNSGRSRFCYCHAFSPLTSLMRGISRSGLLHLETRAGDGRIGLAPLVIESRRLLIATSRRQIACC